MPPRPSGSPEHPAQRPGFIIPLAILLFATIASYLPLLEAPFWADDLPAIVDNEYMDDVENIPRFFVTMDHAIYAPIMFTFANLLIAAFGLDPTVHHAASLLLHTLAALLCFGFLAKLTGSRKLAWFASLLFAVHPIHSETVGLSPGGKDVFPAVFMLLGLQAHLDRGTSPLAVAGAFLLALFSKESGLVFPLLLVACDIFTLARSRSIRLSSFRIESYLGCIAVLAGYTSLRIWLFGRFADFDPTPYVSPYASQSYLLTVPEALLMILRYLKLLFFPLNLSFSYTLAEVPILGSPLDLRAMPGWALGASLLAAGLLGLRKAPWLSFYVGFFVLALLPVSNLIVRTGWMSERYLYVPSIVWCVAMARLLGWQDADPFAESREGSRARRTRRRVALFLSVALVLSAAARTRHRAREFCDPDLVIAKSYRAAPGGYKIQFLRGGQLLRTGKPAEAEEILARALVTAPEFLPARLDLARAYLLTRRFDAAQAELDVVLEGAPRRPVPNYVMGLVHLSKKDFVRAAEYFRRTVALDPTHYPEPAFNLGYALFQQGELLEAASAYARAVATYPGDPRIEREKHRIVASFLRASEDALSSGGAEDASLYLERALSLDPQDERALRIRARISSERAPVRPTSPDEKINVIPPGRAEE